MPDRAIGLSTGLGAAVRDVPLTGLSTAANPAVVTATDTIATATAKLKFQLATVGIETINIRRRMTDAQLASSNPDITTVLNTILEELRVAGGGGVYLPRGEYLTNGGHPLSSGVTMVGDGWSPHENKGTRIRQNPSSTLGFMLEMNANTPFIEPFGAGTRGDGMHGVILKDFAMFGPASGALLQQGTGLYMHGVSGNYMLKTQLRNVGFFLFGNAIKSEANNGVDPIQNDGFDAFNCGFWYNRTIFYCGTDNGSYYFYKPYGVMSTIGTTTAEIAANQVTGFYCQLMGTLVVEKHHIVGTGGYDANGVAIGNTCLLRTIGKWNHIRFAEGQDEMIRYFYQNANPYHRAPIQLEANSIQSRIEAARDVIFTLEDNYFVNLVGNPNIHDSPTGKITIIKKGHNNVETRNSAQAIQGESVLARLTNIGSRVIDVKGNVRGPFPAQPIFLDSYPVESGREYVKPYRMPAAETATTNMRVNSNVAVINVPTTISSINIYNTTMYYNSADDCSVIEARIEGEPGVTVANIVPNTAVAGSIDHNNYFFTINFSAATTATRKVYFKVL